MTMAASAASMTTGQMAGMAGANILGQLGSSFLSNAFNKQSQYRSYKYAKKLQQHQYDLSIRGYKEGPSAQRTGMESAGFNPMLAVGSVGNGVSVAGGTPVSANATDVSGIRDAVSSSVQLQNQTAQTEASTDQMYAEADKAKAEKASVLERLPFISKQAKADYMKTTMETAKLENDIHYQNEYLNYLSNTLSNAKEIALLQTEAQKYGYRLNYQGTLYNADTNNENSKRTNRSNVSLEHIRRPYSSFFHKVYTFGKSHLAPGTSF